MAFSAYPLDAICVSDPVLLDTGLVFKLGDSGVSLNASPEGILIEFDTCSI
jgi:hypothetical protein